MKRILIFVGLKIVEIGGFVIIPYWVGVLGRKIPGLKSCPFWNWFYGVWLIIAVFAIGSFIFLFFNCIVRDFVKVNWELAKKIADKIESES